MAPAAGRLAALAPLMHRALQARFHASLEAIPSAQWDALRPNDNPFLSHAFLAGLERHGCLQPRAGWRPHHLALYDDTRLVAAAPCYLKSNSHGEFVFDHAWAEAYWRHGLDYFPKLLCAVPYSPVPGPRLLCGAAPVPALRAACLQALQQEAERAGLSSVHVNFDDDVTDADVPGWLPRFDWQFHWHNRGWPDFEAFLSALSAKKRKNIRQERAQVRRAGIRFRCLHGDEASEADLDAMHAFYIASFIDKGNLPVLTREFFGHLARTLPRQLLLVLAERGGSAIAGALLLRSSDTLYGRYWGCSDPLPGLHFETCYYQGIDYCLRHGLARFEPGAQGEHKLARGFLPTRTHSLHHLRDPRFSAAVAASLRQEAAWLEAYRDELLVHSPYRE
jgi:uncharacterized protein